MLVFEYATAPAGVTHLMIQTAPNTIVPATLCGHRVYYGWSRGDETATGVRATCITCQRKVRTMLRRQAEQ